MPVGDVTAWPWGERTVLVTGGLGFIGSNLALRLAELGARVRVVDALIPEMGGNRANLDRKDVHVAIGDVRDAGLIARLLEDVDTVFHLAGAVSHTRSMSEPLQDLELNCHATLVLLEERRKQPRPSFLVYAGSRSQYGRTESPMVDEAQPLRPVDVNGIHKSAAEALTTLYDGAHAQPSCSLRIGNTYGPRHQMRHAEQGFLHWFIRQAMDGETLRVFGGEQRRDFVFVDDVVNAMLAAASTADARAEAFNIASGTAISVLEVARLIIDVVGSGRVTVEAFPADRAAIEVGDFQADISKAGRLLGWTPRVALREGLERTVAYYRPRRQLYWS